MSWPWQDDPLLKDLQVGAFYWVAIANDPDAEEEWEHDLQPARYAGEGKWNMLGVDGTTDWPMRLVSKQQILPPELNE